MPAKDKPKVSSSDRVTITLGPGQRELLEAIAKKNNTSLSYVIRYALSEFLNVHETKQLHLSF